MAKTVRLVFKNFPLPMHDWAVPAALIGECVRERDEKVFWQYQDFVFDNQSKLSADSVVIQSIALLKDKMGDEEKVLRNCVSDPRTSAAIQEDVDLGHRVGVRSTPTFFVNGERYEGTRNSTQLGDLLYESRAKALKRRSPSDEARRMNGPAVSVKR